MANHPKITTTGPIAAKQRVTRQTVRNWIRAGRLDGQKVAGRWMVTESAAAALERPAQEARP
jgi:predicted site-specific integrase-resolvase